MAKLARKAVAELVVLKVMGFWDAERYLLEFQRLCRILVEATEPMSEAMKLELLLKQLTHVKALAAKYVQ